MLKLLEWSVLITISLVLSLIILGFLIRIIERKSNNYIFNTFGKPGIIVYGVIGTTVHEFSHFIMAKLFLHKVTDVKWFSLNINGNNGELGHVRHSFNKKNIYQRVGNFFIGTAPLLIGSLILMLCYFLLLRNSFTQILNHISISDFFHLGDSFNIFAFVSLLLNKFLFIMEATFTVSNLTSISFWIFLFIAISIGTHMSLSSADLRNSVDGILFIFIISLIISGIFILFKIPFSHLTFYLISFNVFLISFLSIGLLFSLIALVISFIFFRLKKIFIN
ncbi:MAG: hypothetical protein ACRDAU_11190 [Clostridium sp.]